MYRSKFSWPRTSWRWVMPLPFDPWGSAPSTHLTGDCVRPRVCLDDKEKWKFLTLRGFDHRPLSRPARSQSLYQLRYHGFKQLIKIFQNMCLKSVTYTHQISKCTLESWDNSLGIMTMLRVGILRNRVSILRKVIASRPTPGPIHLLYPWDKAAEVWSLHLAPRSRMVELYPIPPYVFRARCLINFTFTLNLTEWALFIHHYPLCKLDFHPLTFTEVKQLMTSDCVG
jgi:hypothetical protein